MPIVHTAHLVRTGTSLDGSDRMKTTTSTASKTQEFLRWQFRQRNRLVTCGIGKSDASGYSVVTVPHHNVRKSPHHNVRKSTVEIYKDLVSALQRHASIAAELRANGWSIASYTTT